MMMQNVAKALLAGAMISGGACWSSCASAEGNRILPFWSAPYPSGYAYTHRPTDVRTCWVFVDVPTLFGVVRERQWACSEPLQSRF